MKSLKSTILFCFLMSSFAYSSATNAKSAIDEAKKAGKFLLIAFYANNDASFAGMSKSMESFQKSSKSKFLIYKAQVDNPANKEVADSYGIQAGNLPLVLVLGPNGAITGGYPKAVTPDQLKKALGISDLVLRILKTLQEQKVALVAFQNGATTSNAESWQGVSDFANDANYKQYVAAIKADPASPGSQEFIKQCQLAAPVTQAIVVVLTPPGRINKVFTGRVTKADILKSLQACSGGSGCCPGR